MEITLLAEGITKDFQIPDSMQVGVLAELCGRAFTRLTHGRYQPAQPPILYDRASGQLLDPDLVIHQTGVRNGSKLLMY